MRCGCGGEEKVKNGLKNGKQNYLCKECGTQFTTDVYAVLVDKLAAVKMYLSGISLRAIAKKFKCSHVTIQNWIKQYKASISLV